MSLARHDYQCPNCGHVARDQDVEISVGATAGAPECPNCLTAEGHVKMVHDNRRESHRLYMKAWSAAHPERCRLYQTRRNEKRRHLRQTDPQWRVQENKRQRELRLRLRDECLAAYGGPICVCCGETEIEFLNLDHKAGGGNDHRRLLGYPGIYSWLRKRGFPTGYQVLCYNCNLAKSKLGQCPHERAREATNAVA